LRKKCDEQDRRSRKNGADLLEKNGRDLGSQAYPGSESRGQSVEEFDEFGSVGGNGTLGWRGTIPTSSK